MRSVRARRVRHVPQRPIHRAGHQRDRRLRQRVVDGRDRLRDQDRSAAGAGRHADEPTTVVAKAWEQVEKVGSRSWLEPERVLVTGAGPIGLLAALLGVQRGLDVHVVDLATAGPKLAVVGARCPLPFVRHRLSASWTWPPRRHCGTACSG
ncbi:hypothetical protein [Actinoplanes sp. NPDC026619]|uniref:hypothetical protein n=1 Tax=Actinoplanes sp. NPDC026619 TaxID=3155798 RepID=UPI00340BC173